MGFILWSRDGDVGVVRPSHRPRTFGPMATRAFPSAPVRMLLALGNAGAVANAYRACEERRLSEARVDALAARLAARPRETQTVAGAS